ncbi:hypothetical protein FQV37_2224 [Psychrobacter nivimaris]|uniref:Uncharacterized protein n=2 Tax=Psychrobacter TaxID=497 RepID=A0A6N7BXX6_9GAMM|nr:hypothetical protein [Psychrobacter nivimaris]KAF0567427.1 hypothetical protein FQV37_2224 [Psychrobacter nivimaris]
MNNINKLNTLLNVINQLFAVGDYGVNHIEFLFIGVRNLLEEDEVVRKIFFDELMKSINESLSSDHDLVADIDSDLLCYLAHTTRWPEFYEFVKRRQEIVSSRKKIRYSKDLSEAIQEALQLHWEDVEFYNKIK